MISLPPSTATVAETDYGATVTFLADHYLLYALDDCTVKAYCRRKQGPLRDRGMSSVVDFIRRNSAPLPGTAKSNDQGKENGRNSGRRTKSLASNPRLCVALVCECVFCDDHTDCRQLLRRGGQEFVLSQHSLGGTRVRPVLTSTRPLFGRAHSHPE